MKHWPATPEEAWSLAYYIRAHHYDLYTQEERNAFGLAAALAKAPRLASDRAYAMTCAESDDDRREAASCLLHALQMTVGRRIFEARGESLEIAQCPDCDAVLRTPMAKQCMECGYGV